MHYRVRPLSDRTWLRPAHTRQQSRFDSTWTSTLDLLGREVEHLRGRDVVIEVDVPERGIRQDGRLRADARAESPAVVVAFESKHGPMQYRCDRFVEPAWRRGVDWQQNVRAIALTLEALRAVDRYGAVDTGQQYAGFKALPAGRAMPASHMTWDQALEVLGQWGRVPRGLPAIPGEYVNTDPTTLRGLHRSARRWAHPDRNDGDQTAWDQVEQAAKVLGIAG
jgi:hypothetical protein